jgi:GNAT superfamily N-acetyltransferase
MSNLTDVSLRLTEALACHSAACRPPSSGGTGGSLKRRPLPDVSPGDVRFSYRPRHPDGHPDPGEIVWAHVPFEDDPSQGKDRPVLIVGRATNGNLVGVQLTSKTHRPGDMPIEWGDGKPSSVRPERFIQVDLTNYRKEGAYVKKPKFQDVVDYVSGRHGLTLQQFVFEVGSFACQDASCAPPPVGTGGSKARKLSPTADGRVVPYRKIRYLDHETLDELGVGHEGLDVVNRARKFIQSWYETDLPGGYRTEAKAEMRNGTDGPFVEVEGRIYGPSGVRVGSFDRTVTLSEKGKTVVSHDELRLDPEHQGKGLGEALNTHSMQAYEKYGVDRVELWAGYAVGGYAWAVAGFRAVSGGHDRSHQETMSRLIESGAEKIYGLGARGVFTKDQVDKATSELETLDRALKSGEDVQPIHVASVGRDATVRIKSDDEIEYETWPGKEALLGSNWKGVYYLGEPLTASAEELACRDASCAPPPVGTGGSVSRDAAWQAHRGRITSLSQDVIDRAISKGPDGIFGVGDLGTVPWPTAPRSKGERAYDPELVQEALRKPPRLEPVDPRILYATQPRLVRQHLNYYLTDEYARTGRPSADQTKPANAFPIIYVNAKGQHIILTGHHRAAAALVKNEDLDAIVVRES